MNERVSHQNITNPDEIHPGSHLESRNIESTGTEEKYLCLSLPYEGEMGLVINVIALTTKSFGVLVLSDFSVVPMRNGKWNNVNFLYHSKNEHALKEHIEIFDDDGRPVDIARLQIEQFPRRIKKVVIHFTIT